MPPPWDPDAGSAAAAMNHQQRRALEQGRDAYAVLGSFMHLAGTGVRGPVREDTYRQLTDELLDAVGAAQAAGVPEAVIFDNM